MKLAGAPGGIKFALGENVKQSNWGDAFKYRFPQTRMGVPAFHTNRFTAAKHYAAALEKQKREGGPPVRRDLELEAIAEIIKGERLVHCHSYRQDEILAFLRVMESFGVRVATLQHILEGYKVADEIAKHGAGASAFSDWWAYKFEVYDAIPHAGSIMRERGVLVSFNSDSSDHARRMNFEAAKAVKYGGTPEDEALKFVTINPAKQLGIDKWVGSLEPGKDGDFAVWSGNPLETSSRMPRDVDRWETSTSNARPPAVAPRARHAERLTLIEKAKKLATDPTGDPAADKAQEKFFFRTLEDRQSHLLRRIAALTTRCHGKTDHPSVGRVPGAGVDRAGRDAAPARRDRAYRGQWHARARRRARARWTDRRRGRARSMNPRTARSISRACIFFPGSSAPAPISAWWKSPECAPPSMIARRATSRPKSNRGRR